MNIVTHVAPDWDAIGAVWLLQRYGGLESVDVRFVNTGRPDPDVLDEAAAVVDTGRIYDPLRLRFDHHHLPGAEANATCATQQVYHWLIIARPNVDWSYLGGIVDLIYAGDTGKAEAQESRRRGIHALLSAHKARNATDLGLLAWGMDVLDDLAAHAKARHEAAETLAQHMVYCSADGLLVALKDAPAHASSAAFEVGARLVVFQNESPETNAIGVWRSGEWQEPHCGELVRAILDYAPAIRMAGVLATTTMAAQAVFAELETWYRHSAGFFCGRGTDKAPDPRPITVDLIDVARAIDAVWQR